MLKSTVAFLSCVGASMIIISVLREKKNRENIQQRLIGLMSCSDLILCFLHLTGHLWLPTYASSLSENGVSGVGNDASCNASGFLYALFGHTTLAYNDSLALYYLLIVKYNWTPRKLKKIEIWFHLIPWSYGLLVAISAAATVMFKASPFSPYFAVCFPYPTAPDTFFMKLSIANLYLWLFAILFNFVCLLMVYLHVRKTEKRSARWSNLNSSHVTLERTRIVAKQCVLYFIIIAVPWTLVTVNGFLGFYGAIFNKPLDYLNDILVPLSGLLNSIVYFRMRYGRLRKDHSRAPKKQIIFAIFRDTLFPCLCPNFEFQSRTTNDGKDLEPSLNSEDAATPDLFDRIRLSFLRRRQSRENRKTKMNASNRSSTQSTGACGGSWKDLKNSGVTTINKSAKNTSLQGADWKKLKASGVQTINADWKTLKASGVKTISSTTLNTNPSFKVNASISTMNDSNRGLTNTSNRKSVSFLLDSERALEVHQELTQSIDEECPPDYTGEELDNGEDQEEDFPGNPGEESTEESTEEDENDEVREIAGHDKQDV